MSWRLQLLFAVLILILFGIMLTNKLYDMKLNTGKSQFFPAVAGVVVMFAILVYFMLRTSWFQNESELSGPTTASIGELLMQDYILPFEVASILLLLALIGAAMIVRRRSE